MRTAIHSTDRNDFQNAEALSKLWSELGGSSGGSDFWKELSEEGEEQINIAHLLEAFQEAMSKTFGNKMYLTYELINDEENGTQISQIKISSEEFSIFNKSGEAIIYMNSTDFYWGDSERTLVASSNARPTIQIAGQAEEERMAFVSDITKAPKTQTLVSGNWAVDSGIMSYTIGDYDVTPDSLIVVNFPDISQSGYIDSAGYKFGRVKVEEGSFTIYMETRPSGNLTLSYKIL